MSTRNGIPMVTISAEWIKNDGLHVEWINRPVLKIYYYLSSDDWFGLFLSWTIFRGRRLVKIMC